jgi:hypothetical protein
MPRSIGSPPPGHLFVAESFPICPSALTLSRTLFDALLDLLAQKSLGTADNRSAAFKAEQRLGAPAHEIGCKILNQECVP